MKASFLSKLKSIVGACALIVVGALSVVVFQKPKESVIPSGVYSTIFVGRSASYQMNIDQLFLDEVNQKVTMWVREDRNAFFISETKLAGLTIFSRITLDCKNLTVSILEQRAFGEDMKYSGTSTDPTPFDKPNSPMTALSMLDICGSIPGIEQVEPLTPDADSEEPLITT